MELKVTHSVHLKRNWYAFIIHAFFLALTLNFIDMNTVVPSMVNSAGGTALHMGIISAIMIGGTKLMQLPFAHLIQKQRKKKKLSHCRYLCPNYLIRTVKLALRLLFHRFTVNMVYYSTDGSV
jgi:hypothetical protein